MATLTQSIVEASLAADAIAANVAAVHARIVAAAARAGRDPSAGTLVAVSKTVPLERLRGVERLGLADLGENRVQEATAKVEALGGAVTWHLIGHLQSNKAKAAVRLFDLIHSVDSLELAEALDRHAASLGTRQRVLFQVNVSGEESKGGFAPAALEAAAERLAALPHLQPEGLMSIAPLGAAEPELRSIFRALRARCDALAPLFGEQWRHLSMGMTDDFELAVEEGATLVRVGRAIFGERPLHDARESAPRGEKQEAVREGNER